MYNYKKRKVMKKIIATLALLFTLTATAGAMSYEQAREQALFLTDKMAYELNLTEEQYDAAYEVNLDYLMSVNTPDDLYDLYWRQRNLDLSYILLDWQYRAFCAATYFYRPLYWTAGVWHFAIYSRYPRRNYFYFGRPNIYITYRGGHSWRHNGGRSWYKGRTFHHGAGAKGHGLRDRFDRGDFNHGGRHHGNGGSGKFNNGGGRRPHTGTGNGFVTGRGDKNTGTADNRPQADKQRPGHNFRGNRGSTRNHRESSTRTTARPYRGTKPTVNTGNRTQKRPSNIFTPKNNNRKTTVNRSAGQRKSFNSAARGGGNRNKPTSGNKGGGHGGNFGGKR